MRCSSVLAPQESLPLRRRYAHGRRQHFPDCSIVGDVTDNGTLVFNRSDTALFDGTIFGSGTVTQAGTGTTVLTGNNTYTGGTTISAGTLQLGNGGTTGSIVGNVTNDGTLAFNRADTMTFGGVISGSGGVSQIGSGTTILNANNTYSGPTQVRVGTLAVGDPTHTSAALSGGGLTTVASGATLGGYGSVAGNVVNNGTIAVANALSNFSSGPTGTFTIGGNVTNSGLINLAGTTPGNVLRIDGNYTGTAGSAVQFNTVLNAGGPLSNQFTDRLLISGSADPSTVQIRPSGSGAFTSTGLPTNTSGISIIQVAGSSYPGAFTLPGGYITGGTPFQYHLNAYGPGSANGAADPSQNLVGNAGSYWDFRLQNVYVSPSGEVAPGAAPPANARLAVAPQIPSYITVPTALFNAGLQDIQELHRRLGEIRDCRGRCAAVGIQGVEGFFRAYGGTYDYTTNRSFSNFGYDSQQDYAAFQMGVNAMLIDDAAGTLRVGLAGSFGALRFSPIAVDGQSESSFTSEKLALLATYQARSGWYLDAIVTGGVFNGTVSTAARGQVAGLSGTSVGASLEGGYQFALGWQGLLAEPQVQVSWQHLNFNGNTDVDGLGVDLGNPNQGVVRVGGRLIRPFETDSGKIVAPYLKLNLLQGFADGQPILVSGFAFDTGTYGTALQVGGGITGMLTDRLAVYGDVGWQHQLSDGGVEGWSFNGGFRYQF
jgi:outer membrane autotransporter protein